MKTLIICAWIVFSTVSIFAGAQESMEIGPSCPDLAITGITNKKAFVEFMGTLKIAAAKKDAGAMAKHVLFPLEVNSKQKGGPINNETELKEKFSKVFTGKIVKAIIEQNRESLSCRDQGVMLGNGEVWIKEKNGKIGLAVIDL